MSVEVEDMSVEVEELYNKLKKHFMENGYVIIEERHGFHGYMEARHPQKEFVFEQMTEGEYLESGLHQVSNQLLVQYDIFTGEFAHDIFVKDPENEKLAKEWLANLEREVKSLGLEVFIDPWQKKFIQTGKIDHN